MFEKTNNAEYLFKMLVLCTLFIIINKLITTKVDSNYFGLINQQCITYLSCGRDRTQTIGSVAKCLTLSRHTRKQNPYIDNSS